MSDSRAALVRALPVSLALAPIGVLFGILAAQANWSLVSVLLFSAIGFTGSGQFTYLTFYNQDIAQVGYVTLFFILLSINLRYIPMSLSASATMPCNRWLKALFAHYLADESYSTETVDDTWQTRAIIRLTIAGFWVIATGIGVLAQGFIPASLQTLITGLTFPISIILILLSYANIMRFISHHANYKSLLSVGFGILLASVSIALLGVKYFWLPSIAACYILLCYFAPLQEIQPDTTGEDTPNKNANDKFTADV